MWPPAVGRPTLMLGAPALQGPFHLPLGIAVGEVAALVDPLLAAGDGDLDLHAPVLPVEAGRNEGQAPLPHLAVERVDLAPVEEELPRPGRIVVRTVALVVRLDLGADEPRVAVADLGVGLAERGAAVAEGLDLGAAEDEAGLDPVHPLLVVARTTVVDDQLLALRLGHEGQV